MEESNQKLLTWEECREEIIKVGEFKFKNGRYIDPISSYLKRIKQKENLFLSIGCLTSHFPKEVSLKERIYHFLYEYIEYLYPICKTCGKRLKFRDYVSGYAFFCSLSCIQNSQETKDKRKNTNIVRTGYENPFQDPLTYIKSKITYKNKTGFDHPMRNPVVKKDRNDKYLKQTGYTNALLNPEVQRTRRDSYKEKTGYDHQSQNPEIKDKKIKTYKERTGFDCPFLNPEVIIKSRESYKKKTGYDNALQNPENKKKILLKSIERGNKGYSKISQELFDAIYEKLSKELKQECYYATCKTKNHNKEFARYDSENNTGYFYDFTLSHLKFIIEFDGNYWHSFENRRERDFQKQEFIEKLGFTVIRVLESEFIKNKQQVIDICLNKILIINNKR